VSQWLDGYRSMLRDLSEEDLDIRRSRNLDLMWSNSDSEAVERYDAIIQEQRRRRSSGPTQAPRDGE
jgi:hypothetical protein